MTYNFEPALGAEPPDVIELSNKQAANVKPDGSDLVRITGYMVRLSDVEQLKESRARNNSTGLSAESLENWSLLDRVPRVISLEYDPRLGGIIE